MHKRMYNSNEFPIILKIHENHEPKEGEKSFLDDFKSFEYKSKDGKQSDKLFIQELILKHQANHCLDTLLADKVKINLSVLIKTGSFAEYKKLYELGQLDYRKKGFDSPNLPTSQLSLFRMEVKAGEYLAESVKYGKLAFVEDFLNLRMPIHQVLGISKANYNAPCPDLSESHIIKAVHSGNIDIAIEIAEKALEYLTNSSEQTAKTLQLRRNITNALKQLKLVPA